MFPRYRLALVCFLLTGAVAAKAQNDASEIERERDAFLAQVLTKCSESTYYFGPHKVNELSCTAPGRTITDCAELIEYKDFELAKTVTIEHRRSSTPQTLDPPGTYRLSLLNTDRLANVQEKVVVLIEYSSSRSRMRVTYTSNFTARSVSPDHRSWAPEWDPWGEPIANITPSLLADPGDSQDQGMVELPPGTKALGIMIKKGDGQWVFAPGPDFPFQISMAQVGKRVGLDTGSLGDQAEELRRPLGPLVIISPLTQLFAQAKLIEAIAARKPKACWEISPKEWPRALQPPPLVRPGTPISPSADAMLHPPKFSGTVDQFADAFPSFLKKAGEAGGFDAQAYQKEVALVINTVRTCDEITPAMVAKVTKPGPPYFGQLATRNIGAKYAVCQSGTSAQANAEHPDTQIPVQIDSHNSESWKKGTNFTVFAFLVRAKQGNYPIVSATIQRLPETKP